MSTVENMISLSTGSLPVDGAVLLSTEHGGRLGAIVATELARWPVGVTGGLPRIHLVERAEIGGRNPGAIYFPEHHAALLAARYDLRGNVHRAVSRALLEKNPDAAARVRNVVEEAGAEAHLYGGLLSGESMVAAVIGAVVHRRESLDEACRQRPALQRAVTAARHFLETVGVDDHHLRSLPSAPTYGYLSRVTGQPPHLQIDPGAVKLTLAPPSEDDHKGYEFDPLSETEMPLAQRSVERAIWALPEGVLEQTVRNLYVVADVRTSNGCDIAGFAAGYDGEAASVVVEHRRGRRTVYHELGHALHFRYRSLFPLTDWTALVPSDGYFGSGRKYIEAGVSHRDYSPDLLARGFVTGYASSSLEEDVAELFEAIMVGDPRLTAALQDSPLVAAKARLLAGFLRVIDPTFSDDYLARLRAERAAQEAAWGIR